MIKRFNCTAGLQQRSGVVYDEIGLLHLVRLGPLGKDALPRLGCREPVTLQQSRQLDRRIDYDNQHQVDPALCAGLEQERRFVNDQIMRRGLHCRQSTLGKMSNGRMDNRLETLPGRGVGKHHLGQCFTVQAAARRQDFHAEDIHQPCQRRTARIDNLAGKQVCTDQSRTACGEHIGNGTFPRSNPPGEAKYHDKESS